MGSFNYVDDDAYCEDVALAAIAKEVGTPAYIYSSKALRDNVDAFKTAFATYPTNICYAVKANSNLSLLREIFKRGLGADLVSLGELARAHRAGCRAEQIVFSGVGKTEQELKAALSLGIGNFNVESQFEIGMIASCAKSLKKVARLALRVNPDIDAKTHPKIATGLSSSKFGIPEAEVLSLAQNISEYDSLKLCGLACHIGSQMTDLLPIKSAAYRMAKLVQELIQMGHRLEHIDMGGGLGIAYAGESTPTIEEYATALIQAIAPTGLKLMIEPGRSLIGQTGILLTKVIGVKASRAKQFVVVDGAMNDLLRPSLYEAYHEILPVRNIQSMAPCRVDVVGPVCETGDYLGLDRTLPQLSAGDLLYIAHAGAYGMAMSSQYNSRPRAVEVLVDGNQFKIIRRRETIEDLWQHEEGIS